MDYLTIMLMSMIPVIELRGAIPIGIASGLDPVYVYIVSVIGSTLVAVPLIITFRTILQKLKKNKIFYKIGNKIDHTINNRMKKLRSMTIIGIIIYVGVPLPTTGSWTASAIASVLRMRIKDALAGVLLGNMLAGTIVSFLTFHIV